MHKLKKGFTLVELLVVIVIIGILAALLLPAIAKALKQAKKANCATNLRSLWQCQTIYVSQYGGQNKLYPKESGGAFWLKLTKTPKPIIDNLNVLICPLAGDEPTADFTSYRGPNGDVNKFEDKDPVGADKDQPQPNHGALEGGNVITRNGSVSEYGETDTTWVEAATKTMP